MNIRRMIGMAALAAICTSAYGVDLVNTVEVPGDSKDKSLGFGSGANKNRLGMGSDLAYERGTGYLYALADRGPGGGTIAYQTRLHRIRLDVNSTTGAISNFKVLETMRFTTADGKGYFNGLNPFLLTGSYSDLGLSFDPEGLAVKGNTFYVADEYGPSVYEFRKIQRFSGAVEVRFVRAFEPPANVLPVDFSDQFDFVRGRGFLKSGRQDNRGYEGLTLSVDGKKLYGIMQDPLIDDGPSQGEGRRSRNVRIVEYDVATGMPGAQYAYQLETIADINGRMEGTDFDFLATEQGRSIGCSSILAISDTDFLVIERDNRGRGVDDPLFLRTIGTKRVYRISLAGATDVRNISFAGHTNDLPNGVVPVSKELFIDVQEAMKNAGNIMPEKLEGFVVGPKLQDGTYSMIVTNDNDFSVTQNANGEQFDVYTDGTQGPIDGDPLGRSLMPSVFMAFKGEVPGFGR